MDKIKETIKSVLNQSKNAEISMLGKTLYKI